MSAEAGHNYTFGSPSKGWPTFGPDGKIVREGGDDLIPKSKAETRVIDLMQALEESLAAVRFDR